MYAYYITCVCLYNYHHNYHHYHDYHYDYHHYHQCYCERPRAHALLVVQQAAVGCYYCYNENYNDRMVN